MILRPMKCPRRLIHHVCTNRALNYPTLRARLADHILPQPQDRCKWSALLHSNYIAQECDKTITQAQLLTNQVAFQFNSWNKYPLLTTLVRLTIKTIVCWWFPKLKLSLNPLFSVLEVCSGTVICFVLLENWAIL